MKASATPLVAYCADRSPMPQPNMPPAAAVVARKKGHREAKGVREGGTDRRGNHPYLRLRRARFKSEISCRMDQRLDVLLFCENF